MKLDLTGRVVGHQIFSPDPKDQPDLELVKISMTLSPATKDATKHTKAVLVVDKDEAFGELVLGAIVRIVVQDKQQEMFPPPAKGSAGEKLKGTISTMDPKTGQQLTADLGDAVETTRVLRTVVEGALSGARPRARGTGRAN